MKKNAFTLIELLMVIVIIGILLGLMTAAIRKSAAEARNKRALSDVRTLKAACTVFRHEYGKWPFGPDLINDETKRTGLVKYPGAAPDNMGVIETLSSTDNSINPKKIRFVNRGDYLISSNNVVSPATKRPYLFTFNLDNDACDVTQQ